MLAFHNEVGPMLEPLCRLAPTIGASAFVLIGLVALAFRRGGTIERISIPGIFDVKLRQPYTIPQTPNAIYYAAPLFAGAVALYSISWTGLCALCGGMPGETAWIYIGQYNPIEGSFANGPNARPEKPNEHLQDIKGGEWVVLNTPLKTMILDYSTRGTMRALDSPFSGGTINYTCKILPKGQRLYVAEKKMRGPSEDLQHIWLRVRMAPPGVSF
jgi:hypothetical protein